jgi:hypothetical protein
MTETQQFMMTLSQHSQIVFNSKEKEITSTLKEEIDMQNITINNHGTINIYAEDLVNKAKDKLLEKLYYARNKETMGGYKAWLKLLDMYYAQDFKEMQEFIKSCHGKGGKTRNECLRYIDIIIKERNK